MAVMQLLTAMPVTQIAMIHSSVFVRRLTMTTMGML